MRLFILQNQISTSVGAISTTTNDISINFSACKTLSAQITISNFSVAGTIQLQRSNDNTNFVNDGSTTAISSNGQYYIEKIDPSALYYRLQFAGTFTVAQTIYIGKGPN